jgi:hypothetical protein
MNKAASGSTGSVTSLGERISPAEFDDEPISVIARPIGGTIVRMFRASKASSLKRRPNLDGWNIRGPRSARATRVEAPRCDRTPQHGGEDASPAHLVNCDPLREPSVEFREIRESPGSIDPVRVTRHAKGDCQGGRRSALADS